MKRSLPKIVLLTLIALIVIAAIVYGGFMCFQLTNAPLSNPQYVAHRGYSCENPDNTAFSFSAAANNEKYYGIETDIRRTTDGYLVCSHDAKVVFSDGTSRIVEESTYAELMEKPLKNTKSADVAHICLFTEYLEICKSGDKIAVTELKDVFTEDMIAQTLAEIDAHYDRKKVTVIAFDYDSLYRMRLADPAMDLQYLSEKNRDKHYEDCLEKGISVDVRYNVATPHFVKKFHDKGLKVNVWTVDGKDLQTRMRKNGVDFITSNALYED